MHRGTVTCCTFPLTESCSGEETATEKVTDRGTLPVWALAGVAVIVTSTGFGVVGAELPAESATVPPVAVGLTLKPTPAAGRSPST